MCLNKHELSKISTKEPSRWVEKWNYVNLKNSVNVVAEFDENFSLNSEVVVLLSPIVDAIDSRGGLEYYLVLIHDRLSKNNRPKLKAAIQIIHDLQGISFDECLRYMDFIDLIFTDYRRARDGLDSLLKTAYTRKMQMEGEKNYINLDAEEIEPLWTIDELLNFWYSGANILSKGIFDKPNKQCLIPTYKIFPHSILDWLTKDDINKSSKIPKPKVPFYVEPNDFSTVNNFRDLIKSDENTRKIINKLMEVGHNVTDEKIKKRSKPGRKLLVTLDMLIEIIRIRESEKKISPTAIMNKAEIKYNLGEQTIRNFLIDHKRYFSNYEKKFKGKSATQIVKCVTEEEIKELYQNVLNSYN